MLNLNLQSKSYNDQVILEGINVTLGKGERLAILGPSGIGKTTLLRIIAGLDQNFVGELQTPDSIALMFQNPNLLPWRNLHDNLAVFHPNKSKGEIHQILEDVGLLDKVRTYPNQLSLGQQRRLALARTFMGSSQLILLDEAFVSLDGPLKLEMIELVERLINNSAMILVTHSMEEAEALGCKIMKLA